MGKGMSGYFHNTVGSNLKHDPLKIGGYDADGNDLFKKKEVGGGRIKDIVEPDPNDLVRIDGYQLHKDAADELERMREAYYNEAGLEDSDLLKLTSGYRSVERQQEIYNERYERVKKAHPDWSDAEIKNSLKNEVAAPGSSPHHTGKAVDLNLGGANNINNAENLREQDVWKWLEKHASEYGFYPYKNEPWHWEYNPPQ